MTIPSDPMADDIRTAIGMLVRQALRQRGELADLERFRKPRAWSVALEAETYIVRWSDGGFLVSIPLDTVAMAVGILRGQRGDPIPPLVN